MSSKLKVAIVGSTGYGGVELIRLLLQHPHVDITSVISSSHAGAPLSDSFPHLTGIINDTLDPVDVELISSKAELIFTATPAGVSTEIVPKFLDAGLKVIDLSGDFRLKDRVVYEEWYKRKPAEQKYIDQAVYGLVEVFGDEVRGAKFISNPGCYSTTTMLGLAPALAAGWIDPKTIIIDAKSGVSGAGRGMSLKTHYSEVNENFFAYKMNKHQHIPEIEQTLSRVAGQEIVITFTTQVAPMTRGIMSTIYANVVADRREDDFIDLYRKYYEGRSFMRIRNKGIWPATKEVTGSNYCDIGFAYDERTGRITIISVTDNVMKGAAGQAVQNLNMMMGWDETTGLLFSPIFP